MGFATDPSSAPVSAGAWPGAMDPGLLGAADDELVADAAGGAPRPGAGRLGVVTALQTEADCLRHLPEGRGPLIHVSGGSALRARAGAEGLREKGVVGLISFGLAIGLAPVLRPGDVVVADSVVLPSGRSIATEPAWRAALLQHLGGSGLKVRVARIAGSDELPASAIAAAANGTDGQPRSLAVVGHLAKRPWEIGAAWRFSKNGRLALDALRRVASIGSGALAVERS
jgi:hypothetical protein